MDAAAGKSVIALTGADDPVGRRVAEGLAADERVSRVVAIGATGPGTPVAKIVFDPVDLRSPAVATRLTGVDAVVHLASVLDPVKDEVGMRDVNVIGSQNVFEAAGRAGVSKVVYLSSALVYGAHPDNPVPLEEDSPLRANLDFPYAAHKLEVEYWIGEIRGKFPGMAVTVLRPAIILGPRVDNAWSHFLEVPVLFRVRGHEPPYQFVHEDDVVDAVAFAVWNRVDGVYNLCPRDFIEFRQLVSLTGKHIVSLSESFAFSLMDRLWGLGLSEAPSGVLHYAMYPWVMSPVKLEAAGYRCSRSSVDALQDALSSARGRIRLGRRRVRTDDLRRGALAGAGVIGVAAAYRRRRKRAAGARALG